MTSTNKGRVRSFFSETLLQVEEGTKNYHDDRPSNISTITSSFSTDIRDDCLDLIFKCLKIKDDRNSFGLTCHRWLHIQNNNHESLWYSNNYDPAGKYPKISLSRVLIRFQRLKILCLGRLPKITDVDTLKSQSFGSNVQTLCINPCSYNFPDYSDMQFLGSSGITDKGLESLAKYCASLKTVNLPRCYSITDWGISVLLQNCQKLCSLATDYCSNITGIGFQGCAQSLTYLAAGRCKLKPEGFCAIGCIINTEAVMTITKGCPLLKKLSLSNCEEVQLDGWKAIGLNCKELNELVIMGCQRLCDMGLQAICDGCNKLSVLYLEKKYSCSSSALELFMSKKPRVVVIRF
ncbi:hypothetical protein MKW98_025174 [Papaver atlanticum]|uniref:Uncharacterized protein n=1 Tax=Papaver atlanticum TaxID=357466 RepID=A0AAD4X6B5_9MAGN|nr:hypothetical protein MKW98_025174 [Papaver atlanticum]